MRELINTYGCYSLIRLHTHKDTQMSRYTSPKQITKGNVKSCAASVMKEGLCTRDSGDKLVILHNEWRSLAACTCTTSGRDEAVVFPWVWSHDTNLSVAIRWPDNREPLQTSAVSHAVLFQVVGQRRGRPRHRCRLTDARLTDVGLTPLPRLLII